MLKIIAIAFLLCFSTLGLITKVFCEEDKQEILLDEVENLKDGPVKFEILGDTSHLFADEDFQKKEAVLLRNDTLNESNLTSPETNINLPTDKKPSTHSSSQTECARLNLTHYRELNKVLLVNGSRLTQILSESEHNECFLVLFYVPWCPFSIKLAPIYNALPKAFLNLDILAFDVSKSIGYNTKFGTSAVPIIILFQHKNVISKFNYTHKNLSDYIEFVANKTGFVGNKSISISEDDLQGPVPTVLEQSFDYYLLISWIFLIFVSCDFIIRKTKFRVYLIRFIRRIVLLIRPYQQPQLNQPVQLQAIENIPQQQHPHSD